MEKRLRPRVMMLKWLTLVALVGVGVGQVVLVWLMVAMSGVSMAVADGIAESSVGAGEVLVQVGVRLLPTLVLFLVWLWGEGVGVLRPRLDVLILVVLGLPVLVGCVVFVSGVGLVRMPWLPFVMPVVQFMVLGGGIYGLRARGAVA
ncbi:MAG TPA: hypothetical protein VLL52_06955 [Anaerolineae bacterium]|nr:hypothetical protein [Anaerolineae bacterium]